MYFEKGTLPLGCCLTIQNQQKESLISVGLGLSLYILWKFRFMEVEHKETVLSLDTVPCYKQGFKPRAIFPHMEPVTT